MPLPRLDQHWPKFAKAPFVCGFVLAACFLPQPAIQATEPVDAFLAALRQHRYYDEAFDYLEAVRGDSHLSQAVRDGVGYEQAITVLESSANITDPAARQTQLLRAADLLGEFLKGHPGHGLSGAAKSQLAHVLVERGRAELTESKHAGDRKLATDRARKLFEQAHAQFSAAEKELDAQLAKMPRLVDPSETAEQAQKRLLANDLVQARLQRASVDYELAHTFEPGSKESKDRLRAAAKAYAELNKAHRTRPAGQFARLWEGRCYQELGETKQALGCFQELMELPSGTETRALKAKATRHALECWTQANQKKYQEAIEWGERWTKEAGAQDDQDSLCIRYLTALAYQGQSNALPAKDPNRVKLATAARQYVAPVASQPGEYQRPARMLLVALAGKKGQKSSDRGAATFAEAFEQGKQALDLMQEASENLAVAQDKAETARLQKQKTDNKALAEQRLEQALRLSDAKSNIDDVNLARYYLSFLAWDSSRYYDAAVLGEFLATRYPDSFAGKKGAELALAAYVQMAGNPKATDKAFETAQIERIAEIIFKRYADQEEADKAALTLLDFYAGQRGLAKALTYLGKVPESSPRRARAELRAGQTLWSAYLRGLQGPAEERPPQAELDQWKKRAGELLAQGLKRVEKAEDIDAGLVTAAFTMAQIQLEAGHPEKAIEWLENSKLGPLALIKANNPAATREPLATESYKLALRAYIGVQPQQLKKAEDVMNVLEKRVQAGGEATAKAAENLTAIYVSLGRELQEELEQLRKAGKKRELEAVTKAFEVFLDRVTKRDSGTSYATLNWVAATYYSLASGNEDAVSPLQAKNYFQKAAAAYQKMLELAEKDPELSNQVNNLIATRLRLAECHRRAGDFDAAIENILLSLKHKPNPYLLVAQVQAAETYQAQGAVDPKGYFLAIKGGKPDKSGKNTIWGWGQIARLTQPKPQVGAGKAANPNFEAVFHQARLGMTEARYRFALTEKDKVKRDSILEAAKQDLWVTYKLQPDLGDKETAAKYDRLLKTIQGALGTSETGLAEFKERDANASAKKE